MPSETAALAGIEVVAIAPGNAAHGLARISAWYLLFDAETLQPLRENGNLLLARPAEEWMLPPRRPANLADLAVGQVVRRPGHPAVYTGVGMSWEDLAIVARLIGGDEPAR